MAERKELTQRVVLNNGNSLDIRVLDGVVIDDVIVQATKAIGYLLVTGRDVFPDINRGMRDYLIKIGMITG
jgi:hypothetical protein